MSVIRSVHLPIAGAVLTAVAFTAGCGTASSSVLPAAKAAVNAYADKLDQLRRDNYATANCQKQATGAKIDGSCGPSAASAQQTAKAKVAEMQADVLGVASTGQTANNALVAAQHPSALNPYPLRQLFDPTQGPAGVLTNSPQTTTALVVAQKDATTALTALG